MKAGRLRTIVVFQVATETVDGYGGRSIAWADSVTVHCEFITTSGREALKSGRLEASATATLRARKDAISSVTEAYRASIGGVYWNIRAVMDFGQRGEYRDFIIERASAGVAV